MEGDAEVIVKTILADDVSHPKYGLMICDILILAADFRSCSFTHVKCIGNSVAHFLARRFKHGNVLEVWTLD